MTSSSTSASNPILPAYAIILGAAVTEAYLLQAQPPAGRSPVPPAGWSKTGAPVSGYLRLSGVWETFGLWYQNDADASQWLLAIRGTVTKADAEADGDADPTTVFAPFAPAVQPVDNLKVHPGFWNLYTDTENGNDTPSMQAQIFAVLGPLVAAGSLQTLYVSGHSLGGALAQLLSLDLALHSWNGATPPVVNTVTFAAPMVGIAANWGAAYAGEVTTSYSVINQYDVVPTQPNLPGWGTVGTAFDLLFFHDPNDKSEAELVIRHSMSNHLYVLQQAIGLVPQQWAHSFTDSVYPDDTDQSEIPSATNLAKAAASRPVSSGPLVAP